MMIIYKLELPFFEKFKIQKDKQWPWNQTEEDGNWNELLMKTIKVTLFNNLVLAPALLYLNAYLSDFEEG